MAITYAAPTGPHAVGVRDGEVLDTTYPALRPEEANGRRLMVRVWYPASPSAGQHRRYCEDAELPVLRWLAEATGAPQRWADQLAGMPSHSVTGAAVAASGFPTLVFSHGAMSWVSQNAPLMEHLASHGYVVWSVAHPGEACGVRFRDSELVRYDDGFKDKFVGLLAEPGYSDKLTGDIARRFEVTPEFLDDRAMGPWSQRWVDDFRAVVDALESGSVTGPAADLVTASDTTRLGVLGMSFGAAAAASAAQQDERVRAAVNLDGGQFLSDLLDTDIRVPLLHLASDIRGQLAAMGVPGLTTLDANEFFFEPLSTAGTRSDVHRLRIEDVTHLELADFVLIPATERASVLPGGGKVDSQRTIDLLNAFIRGHFDAVLLGAQNGFPGKQLAEYPEVTPIDLSPVRTWSLTRA
ncbi:alpha/beta hydrolase family protein [Streptomyces sp. Inha503]|uniref:alpha/beta hydrolase family protein n=1 Tax=Streptomyces sp. Inha503 TaxID=3383314 RepID=UPI0039A0AA2B